MKTSCIKRRQWRAVVAVLWVITVASSNQTVWASETNEVFMKSCVVCHGKDGKADSSLAKKLEVKDLSLSKLTDAQINQQIREGKQENQDASKMPAFKERLTAEEIQSLIAVVKEFRSQPLPQNREATQ